MNKGFGFIVALALIGIVVLLTLLASPALAKSGSEGAQSNGMVLLQDDNYLYAWPTGGPVIKIRKTDMKVTNKANLYVN